MKNDSSTSTPDAEPSPNAGTNGRSAAEAAIEDLRRRGGIFVEAVRATRMPMALTDPNLPGNPIVFANEAFLKLSGYRMEEVLGQQPHFMDGPDTDSGDTARFAESLRSGQDDLVETVQYRKDGSRFVATVLLSAFKDAYGKVLNHFMSWLDVTRRVAAESEVSELRRTQSALRASEARYRGLFDSIDEGFCVIEVLFDQAQRPVDYVFLEANPAFVRQTGLNDAVGKRMRDLAPEHEQHWFDIYGRIALTGEPERFEQPANALGRYYDVYAFRVGAAGSNEVAILFNDIGERKRAEAAIRESDDRQAFLLKLSDALQPLADAAQIQGTTSRLLGEHLGVDRAMYAEVDGEPGTETGIIRGQYVRPPGEGEIATEPFPDRFTYADYGEHRMAARDRGELLVVSDIEADSDAEATERANWKMAGVRAAVVAPLVKSGRLVAEFGVHSSSPRAWSDAELLLIREVAERTWAAAERARAEQALRDSEEKYRTLFDTIDSGYALTDNVRNEEGRVVDLFGVDFNRSYTQHSGLPPFAGRRASEVITVQPEWLRQFEEVTRTGVPARYENYIAERDRWVSTHYSLVGVLGSDRVAVVFDDITDRKRAEAALRESEERQAFLLELGDAMRAEAAADAKIAVAARLLGEKLDASRVLFAEYDHEKGLAYIFSGWLADGAQPFPSEVKLEDFEGEVLDDLRAGRVVRVDDVGRLGAKSGYAAIASTGVQALLSQPLLVDGTLKFNVSIHQHEPRHWTDDEVALVQEVAERSWAEIVRARAEDALRDSEEQLRLIVESARDYAILTTDLDNRITTWLAGAENVFGWTAEEAIGQPIDITFTPEDRARGEPRKEAEEARRTGTAPNVRWHVCKDGGRVFIEGHVVALRNALGEVHGFLKIGQDTTERHRASELQATLLAELQHRVRNIMAMIRSIARRTSETTETVEDYFQHLEGRISAMARTQALLTREVGAVVDLQNLILDELEMQAAQPGQYVVSGPDVSLPAKAAEVLGLALHELATNSIKYGALSAADGRIDVRWAMLDGEERPQLSLIWSELGLALADEPRRSGFGTELITRRVPYELNGTGTLEFRPTGLVATIEFPLAEAPSILQTDHGVQRWS